jgi:hypothetical protein
MNTGGVSPPHPGSAPASDRLTEAFAKAAASGFTVQVHANLDVPKEKAPRARALRDLSTALEVGVDRVMLASHGPPRLRTTAFAIQPLSENEEGTLRLFLAQNVTVRIDGQEAQLSTTRPAKPPAGPRGSFVIPGSADFPPEWATIPIRRVLGVNADFNVRRKAGGNANLLIDTERLPAEAKTKLLNMGFIAQDKEGINSRFRVIDPANPPRRGQIPGRGTSQRTRDHGPSGQQGQRNVQSYRDAVTAQMSQGPRAQVGTARPSATASEDIQALRDEVRRLAETVEATQEAARVATDLAKAAVKLAEEATKQLSSLQGILVRNMEVLERVEQRAAAGPASTPAWAEPTGRVGTNQGVRKAANIFENMAASGTRRATPSSAVERDSGAQPKKAPAHPRGGAPPKAAPTAKKVSNASNTPAHQGDMGVSDGAPDSPRPDSRRVRDQVSGSDGEGVERQATLKKGKQQGPANNVPISGYQVAFDGTISKQRTPAINYKFSELKADIAEALKGVVMQGQLPADLVGSIFYPPENINPMDRDGNPLVITNRALGKGLIVAYALGSCVVAFLPDNFDALGAEVGRPEGFLEMGDGVQKFHLYFARALEAGSRLEVITDNNVAKRLNPWLGLEVGPEKIHLAFVSSVRDENLVRLFASIVGDV